ncbi:MAG: hypothetical protein ACRCUY_00230 [Thermoguttaceae bacterium]
MKQLSFFFIFVCTCIYSHPLFSQAGNTEKKEMNNSRGDYDIEDELDFVPVADRIKALDLIGKSSESNYSKIRTWKGQYDFEDVVPFSKTLAESLKIQHASNCYIETKGHFIFLFDVTSKKIFIDFHPRSATLLPKINGEGFDVASIVPPRVLSIVTPESYMHFKPEKKYGVFSDFPNLKQTEGRVVYIEQATKSQEQQEATVPDPSAFFRIGPRFLWEEIDMLIEAIKIEDKIKDTGASFSVSVYEDTANRSVFKIVLETGQKNETVKRTIFVDGKQGFNLMKFYDRISPSAIASPFTHVVSTFKFVEIDGIFIPDFIELHYPSENTGKDIFVRCVHLKDSTLNTSFSENDFTYHKFSLANGDRVRDNIKNELLFFADRKLTKSPPGQYSENTSQYFALRFTMIVIGTILIFTGLAIRMSKKRNSPVRDFRMVEP